MNLPQIINLLNEKDSSESSASKPSASKDISKSRKGRVKTYSTIRDALASGQYGEMFSTRSANRLYVISKGKWGAKSGRGKIAKGFTPGSATPSAEWGSVKDHAARVGHKHGGKKAKKLSAEGRREARKGKKYRRKTKG